MVITESQREDMRNCEENEMCNECVECSASVCLMSCEKEIDFYNKYSKLINELESKATKWDDTQTQADLELAQAVKAWFNQKNLTSSLAADRGMVAIRIKTLEKLIEWHKNKKVGNHV